jgi:hypothetical protein
MKVVNVITQAQWDIVTKELGYKWVSASWKDEKADSCININEQSYADIHYLKIENYTILTFNEWLLEHCETKYPVGTKIKPLNDIAMNNYNGEWVEVKYNRPFITNYDINNPAVYVDCGKWNCVVYNEGKWADILSEGEDYTKLIQEAKVKYPIGTVINFGSIFEIETDDFFADTTSVYVQNRDGSTWGVYDTNTKKWGIIVKSPQSVTTEKAVTEEAKPERKVIGYKAPMDLYKGDIQKGDIFEIDEDGEYICWSNRVGTDVVLPAEIVETWEPVYEKKEGDEQREYWDELTKDWINSTISNEFEYLKQQTKFKLIRN